MDTKKVEEKLRECLNNLSNDVVIQEYIGQFVMLLDEKKITMETACLAIDGIDLDHGVNFLDVFESLDKKQVQDAWKKIRDCASYKKNQNYDSLKLMTSFAASALAGDINAQFILGNILTAIVDSSKFGKKDVNESNVYKILREYLFEPLQDGLVLPEWDSVKISPEKILALCNLLEQTMEHENLRDSEDMRVIVHQMNLWVQQGKTYAEEVMELQQREKNKPQRKALELAKLAEHFKAVEDELEKVIHENVQLTMEQKKLMTAISTVETEKQELEEKVRTLEKKVSELNSDIQKANQTANERKALNDAQVQYRKDSKVALLNDIARSLRAEYGDFAETKDIPMNETLGEIYREKLKQIFKILDQKGIKMEG